MDGVKSINLKKLCTAAMLVAVGVAASAVNFPIGASRCCPAQAFVNVVSGVLLGPWYAAGVGFCCALIRNLLGTGTLLAFPGSIFGALLAGLLYKKVKPLTALAAVGELFGTSILGALTAYPIAKFVMGKQAAVFGLVLPFFISSLGGAVIAFVLIAALEKSGVLRRFAATLEGADGHGA